MTVPQIITPGRKLKTPEQQHQALVKQTQKWVAQTFYGTIFKQMRESPFKDKIMSGGRGGEAFGGMLDQQMADRMAKSSGAKLVCLCSSDAVYARQAADAAKALTAAGAIVHLAGRPADHEAAWREAGVKTFIYAGGDALSTLQAAHDILDLK